MMEDEQESGSSKLCESLLIPVTFVRTVAEELCALKFVTNHFDTEESVLNQYTSARSLGNLSLIFSRTKRYVSKRLRKT